MAERRSIGADADVATQAGSALEADGQQLERESNISCVIKKQRIAGEGGLASSLHKAPAIVAKPQSL